MHIYIYGIPPKTYLFAVLLVFAVNYAHLSLYFWLQFWVMFWFAVSYAHFELIFLVAILGHVLVDLWGVPYITIEFQ